MVIHIVAPQDNIYSIAMTYGVPMSQVILDNGLELSSRLAVGQALVIQFPKEVYTVQVGDTLSALSRKFGISMRQLYRNNPVLQGDPILYPDQTLVLSYEEEGEKPMLSVNGYAYPYIDKTLLQSTIPYLTDMTPFTYGIATTGSLVDLEDASMIALSKAGGAAPLMHLSTLTEDGRFSNALAHLVLNDMGAQNTLVQALLHTISTKGYSGLDVDFEYVLPEDEVAYTAFLQRLSNTLNPLGYPVLAALAPKTSADQKGLLYEAHNYKTIGAAVNEVLLMTYEWGYTYSEPMAVAPIPNVRRVVEYALTEIPASKIWLGVPNYGYDWPLPYVKGETKATSLSSQQAVELAVRYGAEIQYDQRAQSPWFQYTDQGGVAHEVWFEDARSIQAKLALIPEYQLLGAGYWNLMRRFPQNWRILNALYTIRDGRLSF